MAENKYVYFDVEKTATDKYAIETPADFPKREDYKSDEEHEEAGLKYINEHALWDDADLLDRSTDTDGAVYFHFEEE